MNKEKRTLVFNILVAIIIVSVGTVSFFAINKAVSEEKALVSNTSSPQEKTIFNVQTTPAVLKEHQDNITAVGSLTSNESVIITSEINGKIVDILFREGQTASKGQVLVRLDNSTLSATLASAEATRIFTRAKKNRSEALMAEDAISKQDMDEAYANWQKAEAEVVRIKSELDKTVIKAPFNGTLGLRQVSLGAYVQQGTEIVNLEDISKLKFSFSIPQIDAHKIKVSQKFMLKVDSYPDETFMGEIYAVSPIINQTNRSLSAIGIVNNTKGLLKPGQFAVATISVGDKVKSVFIPEGAVKSDLAGKSIFINDNGTAKLVSIQTGKRNAGLVEVLSGVEAGENVIFKGQDKLQAGSSVRSSD